jgi:hypothetical protein
VKQRQDVDVVQFEAMGRDRIGEGGVRHRDPCRVPHDLRLGIAALTRGEGPGDRAAFAPAAADGHAEPIQEQALDGGAASRRDVLVVEAGKPPGQLF